MAMLLRCVWGMLAVTAMAAAQGGTLLVAEKGAHSLAIVDPVAGKVVAHIAESGITGHEVIASPDGKFAYVPIYGNSGVGLPGTDGSTLDIIDLTQQKVASHLDFGHGVRPHCPLFGPKDGLLYVTTELDQTISIIDPKTAHIVGTVSTGQPESHMLAISHDGTRGYTANVGPGTISVLDLTTRKTRAIVPVAKTVQRISISNDDRWVFTSDQGAPRMAILDTKSNEVTGWIPLAATGYGSAPTPDGRWLLVALPGINQVAVIDLTTRKVARNISVPSAPQEVVVRPDGKAAYVSCAHTGQVAEIDLEAWKVSRVMDVGKGADGVAWAK